MGPKQGVQDSSERHTSQRPKTTPAGKLPVRLDAILYQYAEAAAEIGHRSVPQQIEYWANLGRSIDRHLSQEDKFKLLSGEKYVENIVLRINRPVDSRDVLTELEADRASGALSSAVTRASVVYDITDADPGFIRRTNEVGEETLGYFANGHFVPKDKA